MSIDFKNNKIKYLYLFVLDHFKWDLLYLSYNIGLLKKFSLYIEVFTFIPELKEKVQDTNDIALPEY